MTDGALTTGQFLAGLAWLGLILVPIAFATIVLIRRRLPGLPPATALAAGWVIGFGLLVAAHVMPLALGLLSRPAVLLVAAASLVIALRVPAVGQPPAAAKPAAEPDESRFSIAVAAAAVIAVSAWLVAAATGRVLNPVIATDVATENLPLIANWIDSGSLWSLNEFLPLVTQGSYPHNSLIATLALVLPWESDFAVRLLGYAVLPVAGATIYALARELGGARATSVTLAAAGTAIAVFGFATVELVMPDVVLFPSLLGGCLFLIRHHRSGATRDLVVAGIGLGLAFGAKWYGVSDVVVVLAVWAGGSLLAGRAIATVVRQGAALVGLIAACGGVWLARNWAEYGNPLFPLDVSPLGITLWEAPPDPVREEAGASLANRLSDVGQFASDQLPILRDSLGLAGIVLTLGALVAIGWGLARARRGSAPAGPVVAVAVAAIGVLLAYLVTPYTAGPEESSTLAFINSRYALPGLMLAAAACAAIASWDPRVRPIVELFALAAVIDGLANSAEVSTGRLAAATVAVVVAIGLAYVLRDPILDLWRTRRTALVAGTGALAAVAAVIGAGPWQDRFAENRLAQDPTFAAVIRNAPEETRIGTAGLWDREGPPPTLAMLGPRMENEVEYVGEVVDAQLRRYSDREAFVDAIGSGAFDLVIVGRLPSPANNELEWMESLDVEPLAESARFALYPAPSQ